MGEIITFPSNGTACGGYLAVPRSTGPGVIVIQEWWGLVDHIKDVCDRFAAEGFVALAPDLYHGAQTKEPDEAGKLMMQLRIEDAARDMGGAFEYLAADPVVEPKKIGVTGFCMGGALSLVLAAKKPVAAAAPFYGLPAEDPGYENIQGAVLGHFAEHDDWASPGKAKELFARLGEIGKQAEVHVYAGTEHAFFNDSRPEVYKPDAAKQAWDRTIAFFREHLR